MLLMLLMMMTMTMTMMMMMMVHLHPSRRLICTSALLSPLISRDLPRPRRWLIRIFFAASVGFAVPLQVMMTRDAVLRGIAFGAVPGVLCKVASGVAARISPDLHRSPPDLASDLPQSQVASGVAARMAYHSAEEGKAAAAASWATLNGHVQPIQ